MKAFKTILAEILIGHDDTVNIYKLPSFVVNWPTVEEEDSFDEGETYTEELDLENWGIISISEDKMVMCAGGDWQEPLTFTLIAFNDKELKAVDVHEGYENGLSNDKIVKLLSK